MKTIKATIRDVSSYKAANRNLAIYFDPQDVSSLPRERGAYLELELPSGIYRATIGLTASNPPYLHSPLSGPDSRTNWTQVLLASGCDHGDAILFEVIKQRQCLRYLRKLPGEGPPPRRHRSRRAGPHSKVTAVSSGSPGTSRDGSKLDMLDRRDIIEWEERYWEAISESDSKAERMFEREMPAARKVGYLSRSLFLRLGVWKSPRTIRHLERNSVEAIERLTRAAFAATNKQDAIQSLTSLDGVATRMAVAMLHWMRPTEFPILDVRVINSLGWQASKNWEDLAYYERFASHIQSHAARLEVDIRTLDRALWAMDKLS